MIHQSDGSGPKSIVLFSDGTGNSSAKLFKTNVWRMYEGVDLGPNPRLREQVAFYDNGVGTSGFRLLAMLGGIFGFGLKRNILEIYRFACRNYREGDSIYAFGFSRGAFTIRMVVALIAKEGLVRYRTERELIARSVDALRRSNHGNDPNFFRYFAVAGRAVRNAYIAVKRRLSPPLPPELEPWRPEIEFVGVWDTVAAYGGPITEITRAIDNWIWPLSMADYQLDGKVKAARHALALDDARDAFHPLLWDEVNEQRQADAYRDAAASEPDPEKAQAFRDLSRRYETRMKQVWFAGMHADVGGGYPDESLSYVSLRWMMEEAQAAGLRLLRRSCIDVARTANSFGPIHNSRAGLQGYYRYQPRKITAYLHPDSQPNDREARAGARIMRETLSLRDPTLGEQKNRPQGMLLSCLVHESVIARITSGTDDYAPLSLPDTFSLEPPPPATAPARGIVPYHWPCWEKIALNNRLATPEARSPRGDRQEEMWDGVYRRRVAYFATLLFTAMLVLLPWAPAWTEWPRLPPLQWIGRGIGGTIGQVLPGFVGPWLATMGTAPVAFLLLLAAILGSMMVGAYIERQTADRIRRLWRAVMRRPLRPLAAHSRLRRFRNSYAYQSRLQKLKWWILPNVIFGPLLVLLLLYALIALVSQVVLLAKEPYSCPLSGAPLEAARGDSHFEFSTNRPCNYTGLRVQQGREYQILFRVPNSQEGQWKDGDVGGDPGGISASKFDWGLGYLAAPFRRLLYARYLQPLFQIRPIERSAGARLPLMHIDRLSLQRAGATGTATFFYGRFRAQESGELILFANDVATPLPLCTFYARGNAANQGTARVVVYDATAGERTIPELVSGARHAVTARGPGLRCS
jgi:uncharacterized protein (DUF2235 family)